MNVDLCNAILENISRVIVGKDRVTELLLVAILADGHVLLEDVPGLGKTLPLPHPFFVMATQNPIELEGTFPLPEAQLDRFLLKIQLGYPGREEEISILERFQEDDPLLSLKVVVGLEEITALQDARKKVRVSQPVREYISDIVRATRDHKAVRYGSSPRGSLGLMRAAQSLALRMEQEGYALGLSTNAVVTGGGSPVLPIARNSRKLADILERLARMKMEPQIGMEDLFQRGLRVPYGVSALYFSYDADGSVLAAQKYFSYRKISAAFIAAVSPSLPGAQGGRFGGRITPLDELILEGDEKP